MTNYFKIVYIPSDNDKKIEEWKILLPDDEEKQVSCLTDHLQKHFKKCGSVVSDANQNEVLKQQILKQLPKGTKVTDEMMQAVYDMDSLVDTVPVILNIRENQFIGVNMYVDDRGIAKDLSINKRASAIAFQCNKRIEVRGDAFIGRFFDDDKTFKRMDFNMNELDSNAEWFKIACKTQNIEIKNDILNNNNNNINKLCTNQNNCSNLTCSNIGNLRCGNCRSFYYCSKKCQIIHWKQEHKGFCKK